MEEIVTTAMAELAIAPPNKNTKTPSFPGKIGKRCTIAQLKEEAKARGIMSLDDNKKYGKAYLLGILGEGTASVAALTRKQDSSGKPTNLSATNVVRTSSTQPPSNVLKDRVNAQGATSALNKKANNNKPSKPKATMTSATAADDHPRISNKMTIPQLREEVIARGVDPMKAPKTKADLLQHLGEGSIHLKETKEYKDYQSVLLQMATEKPDNEQQRTMQKRAQEKENQKCFHIHSALQFHPHPLTMTHFTNNKDEFNDDQFYLPECDEIDEGLDASFVRVGDEELDGQHQDFASKKATYINDVKRQVERGPLEEEKRRHQQRKREEEQRRKKEEEQNRWNAQKRFNADTITPAAKNKWESSPLNYTVWCSEECRYEPGATKRFDTSWKTKKEANKRAEYLFFWENAWGYSPEEVYDEEEGEPSPSTTDGLMKWSASPPDASRWTVAVVPSVAFHSRHQYDAEDEERYRNPYATWNVTASEEHYGSYF